MPKSGQIWNPALLTKSPLFEPFSALYEPWCARSHWPTLEEYTALFERQRKERCPRVAPLSFAPAEPKRSRARRDSPLDLANLYDGRIALKAEVPCLSESYHDLFNVLMWSAFPRAKRALHGRQYRALRGWLAEGASRLPNRRTREQDALTVFDEGGSVLVVEQEAHWRSCAEPTSLDSTQPVHWYLFGHALMEHVAYGREAVRSAALLITYPGKLPEPKSLLDFVDEQVEQRLQSSADFLAPGADAGIQIDETGRPWLMPQVPPEATPQPSP
jgi:hypothetical protein